jgi:TetR/AcrR family transcriptional repressor of bet genes
MKMSKANAAGAGRIASKGIRRRQLIEATIDSVADRSFSKTTLATVTKGANLSHGIVNYHFKSKELLFAETLGFLANEHRDQWQKTLDKSGTSAQERLLALIDADFHPNICNRKKIAVWFAFYGEATYRSAYRDKCREIDALRLKETEGLCQSIKEEGGYDQVDPRMFATGLEALIDGLWLNMLLYPKIFSRSRARETCLAYLAATFPRHFPIPANSTACRSK